MKLVYIASPYHADTPEEMEKNKQAALDACEQAYIIGRQTGHDVVPITPIVNFPYLDESKPDEREQALKLGLAFLTKCDEVWCAGDRVSEGMKGEIRAAARIGDECRVEQARPGRGNLKAGLSECTSERTTLRSGPATYRAGW